MKLFTKGTIISLILLALTILVSLYVYPLLPNQMISHWGPHGEANGFMGKFWGTFLLPIIMLVVLVMMVVIPRIDPKKRNIETVRGAYDAFLVLLMAFFLVIQKFILGVNLGFQIHPAKFFSFTFGIFFVGIGFIIERLRQNWTIGIRTPWTLSNEVVWNKTHKVGGLMFKIVGIIACLGIVFPSLSFFILLIPLIVGVIFLFFYSYRIYKKEEKK